MDSKMKVGILMGSDSDYGVMSKAEDMLTELGIEYESRVISAHRTPDLMYEFASKARERGFGVLISGAGGAAHAPGMIAALTTLPVIGVPIKSKALNGMDSLLSIVQMPSGIPVATVSIDGAKNAALLAASILAVNDNDIKERLDAFRKKQTEKVLNIKLPKANQ